MAKTHIRKASCGAARPCAWFRAARLVRCGGWSARVVWRRATAGCSASGSLGIVSIRRGARFGVFWEAERRQWKRRGACWEAEWRQAIDAEGLPASGKAAKGSSRCIPGGRKAATTRRDLSPGKQNSGNVAAIRACREGEWRQTPLARASRLGKWRQWWRHSASQQAKWRRRCRHSACQHAERRHACAFRVNGTEGSRARKPKSGPVESHGGLNARGRARARASLGSGGEFEPGTDREPVRVSSHARFSSHARVASLRTRSVVSAKGVISVGDWARKRSSSGMSAMARSSFGSEPAA